MKILWQLLLMGSILIISCKKKDTDAPAPTPSTTTKEDLLRDSVYLYTKEVYLWQEAIPGYDQFKPRQYRGSTELESAEKVMAAIRNHQPLDRFSFVTTQEQSGGLQTGDDRDFGFFIKAASIDVASPVDSVYWFVTYVYGQSSAGLAGVQRGWYISKINGTPVGYDQNSANILNDVFFGSITSANFEFRKSDGSTSALNLSKTSFTANAVLYKNVFDVGGKKVGYFVFNQFFGQPSRNELAQVFNYFQSQNINELIIDLRYNPGGSVETQDTLANLIAPLATNNQTMYKYIFNTTLQNNQHQLIRRKPGYGNIFTAAGNSVNYEKAGNLNLPRIFAIVSGGSASASELLINNLKPYMDVKLIGDTTYGKPVGYFPIPIYNYAIYPVSFKTVNSAGNADYYTGFAPDKLAPDGVDKNWGNVAEPCLAAAIKYITTGNFRIPNTEGQQNLRFQAAKEAESLNNSLNKNKFLGMFIEN